MSVSESITFDVSEQIEALIGFRFSLFLQSLDPVVCIGGGTFVAAHLTTVDQLEEWYRFGCYQNARGAAQDSLPDYPENPYINIAGVEGWMAMQDIYYRGGQVLPGDNQYE